MTIRCLAHQPPVLLLAVLGQQILLLHDLDQPPDAGRQLAELVTGAGQSRLQPDHRLHRLPIGGIHAGLQDGQLLPQVGQGLLDQRLELARRQHPDRAGGLAAVLGVVDAGVVKEGGGPRYVMRRRA